MGLFNWFMPHDQKFFPLFERHAEVLQASAGALRAALDVGPDFRDRLTAVTKYEDDADDVTREVLDAVRTTFVTPFDRGDIKALIESMDDTADEMKKVVKAIRLFEVTEFDDEMRGMADCIVGCADLTRSALALLPSLNRNARRLSEITAEVSKLENQGDEMYDRGLKALFARSRNGNPMDFLRGNEIYDRLEQVIDRFDDVADQIHAILIEHV